VECLSRDRTKHQVAEVTSLGLVQMTRKKLGLGLLETFSEPCDVCAGRGVVVHHDPVVKHRSAAPQNGGSARRPSRQGSTPSGNGTSGGTHMITEGMKSALAQIAASTIAPAHIEADAAAPAAADVPVIEEQAPTERPKKARKKRQPADRAPKTEADQLLDSVLKALPEPKAPGQGRSRRRVTTAALSGTPVVHAPQGDE
jgi:ribonuclease E